MAVIVMRNMWHMEGVPTQLVGIWYKALVGKTRVLILSSHGERKPRVRRHLGTT